MCRNYIYEVQIHENSENSTAQIITKVIEFTIIMEYIEIYMI